MVAPDGYRQLTAADLTYRWRDRTVTESVTESVKHAVGETGTAPEFTTAESALRWLLKLAWCDLQEARRTARNGRWSMQCDHEVFCIVGLTRLVGPMPWGSVPVDLVLDGTFEQIHDLIGVPTPLTDAQRERARKVLALRTSVADALGVPPATVHRMVMGPASLSEILGDGGARSRRE